MLRFILLLIGLAAAVYTMALAIRYGLKGSLAWDRKICDKRNAGFRGYNWQFRIPTSVGVIPEYFYFLVLGRHSYFNARWWALRAAAYISLLLFLAILVDRSTVQSYYSFSLIREYGFTSLINAGSSIWYLNMINILYSFLFITITVESIRMHAWLAPVRILFYSILSILIASISLTSLTLIIALSLLYVVYRIIKWFWTSRKRVKVSGHDDQNEITEKLNNSYRRFRAELYAWEKEQKENKHVIEEREHNKEVKTRRPVIVREAVRKDDDIPRFHPD